MVNRDGGLFDVTGLALVRRIEATGVRVNGYEEHTPEPWNVSRLANSSGGTQVGLDGNALRARLDTPVPPAEEAIAEEEVLSEAPLDASGTQLRAARSAPPPPPAPKERIRLGAPLLPERANDPHYYPGVNDFVPDEPVAQRPWKRWAAFAAGGVVLFAAGLIARGSSAATYSAVVETTPADADVRIDGELVPGANPRTRAGLIEGDHVLLVEREGYKASRQVFSLLDGDRRIVVDLEPEAKAPAEPPAEEAAAQPTAAAAEPAGVEAEPEEAEPAEVKEAEALARAAQSGKKLTRKELAKLKRAERVAQRYRERKAAEKAAKAAGVALPAASRGSSSSGVGFLKINSIPWSEVYVDKKRVGNTPILKLQLPAGRHTIKLKNPDLKISKTIRIKLKAGETITKLEKLGKK